MTAIGTGTVTGNLTKTHALGTPIGSPTTVANYITNVQNFAQAMVNAGLTVVLQSPPYRTDGQDFLGMLPQYGNGLDIVVSNLNSSKCKRGDKSLYYYTMANANDISDGRHPTSQGQTDMQYLWSVGWYRAIWDTSGGTTVSGTKRKVQ